MSLYFIAREGKVNDFAQNVNQFLPVLNQLDNETGKSALHYASENGHWEFVRILLENGANPNIVNSKNNSVPLHSAAYYGHEKVIEELIRAGATTNISNSNRITPLHAASDNNHPKAVLALLRLGADPNAARDKEGATPLHYAVAQGHDEVVEALCTNGANVNITDQFNRTPLLWAGKTGQLEKMGPLLIKFGADVNVKSKDGVSLTMDAKFRRMLASFIKGDDEKSSSSKATDRGWMNPSTYSQPSTNPSTYSQPPTNPPTDLRASSSLPVSYPDSLPPEVPEYPEEFNYSPPPQIQVEKPNQNETTSFPSFPEIPKNAPGKPVIPPAVPSNPIKETETAFGRVLSSEEKDYAALFGNNVQVSRKVLSSSSLSPPISPSSSVSPPVSPPVSPRTTPQNLTSSSEWKSDEEEKSSRPRKPSLFSKSKKETKEKKEKNDRPAKEEKKDLKDSKEGVFKKSFRSSMQFIRKEKDLKPYSINDTEPTSPRDGRRKEGRPLKEGHIWIKRGKLRKTWEIYWFVLHETSLSYYQTPQSLKPIKEITLNGQLVIGERPNSDPLQTFHFEVESKELKIVWVDAIGRAIQNLKEKPKEVVSPPTGANRPVATGAQTLLTSHSYTSSDIIPPPLPDLPELEEFKKERAASIFQASASEGIEEDSSEEENSLDAIDPEMAEISRNIDRINKDLDKKRSASTVERSVSPVSSQLLEVLNQEEFAEVKL